MADEKKPDDQDEVVAVIGDDPDEGTAESKDDEEKPGKTKEGEASEEESEEETEESEESEEKDEVASGDTRVATDADADNPANRERKRETSKERRLRQKEHAKRREKELQFYKSRNEVLERRFSGLENRVAQGEKVTITQAITTVEGQIKEAKRIEALSIKEGDGDSAVEARDIVTALENKHERLVAARDRPAKTTADRTPPPEMKQALSWIDRQKGWYDPKGSTEDSAIASAIEDSLSREGKFDPATEEFWDELDRRLTKRGIKVKGRVIEADAELDDEDDLDDEPVQRREAKNGKANGKGNGKPNGGPKVTVGGEKRPLKPNEVYIDPERKKAMMELGVWDDPKLRKDMLKRYHQFDRDAAASRNH